MGVHFTPAPPVAISRVLATFNRDHLEGFIAVAIDLIDLSDGDPDLEEPGLEDSFVTHFADGPGCPIADKDHAIEDVGHDPEEDQCEAGDDGTIDGKQVVDIALLKFDGSPLHPAKGIAFEVGTLPALVAALGMAASALDEGEV